MSARAQVLVAVLSVATSAFGGPAESVAAALADAKTQPVEIRSSLRYLSLWGVPEKDRETFAKVLAFQCNSLSREADLVLPARVNAELLRINLLDYGWSRETWEKLTASEPYYHVALEKVKVAVASVVEVVPEFKEERVSYDGGRTWQTRRVKVGEKKVEKKQEAKGAAVAHAPWLPTQEITALALALNSDAPVLRADWWLYYTAIQEGRSVGYYDFLGVGKKEADFQEIVGANVTAAKKVKREMMASVARSGVTLNNRGIEWYATITGDYYRSRDYKTSTFKQNTLRLLDGDTEPPQGDASEQYGTLPNGLFAFWLQNAAGERQNTAPDFIASDGMASGTDRRVHIGLSCIRCHQEGIRPISDWMRRVYTGPVVLTSPDYAKLKRLRQLYLSDLEGQVRKSQQNYAGVLKKLNGLTPEANAKAYAAAWDAYFEKDLNVEDAAREWGVGKDVLLEAVKGYARSGNADPIVTGLLANPPADIRREHYEEVYGLVQALVAERRKP